MGESGSGKSTLRTWWLGWTRLTVAAHVGGNRLLGWTKRPVRLSACGGDLSAIQSDSFLHA
jgi:ABC-type glutathione transport system ATPase component